MKIAIKSFLWVSSSYDEPGAAAYQIDLVETAETMAEVEALGGLARVRTGLNVAQAVAEGFDLSAISGALNIETMAALEATQSALAAMTAEREAAEAQVRALTEMLAATTPAETTP